MARFVDATRQLGPAPLGRAARPALAAACGLWGLLTLAGCGSELPPDPTPNVSAAMAFRSATGSAGGAATAVAAPVGTGWGPLRGQFKLDGPAPNLGKLSTAGKDGEVCGQEVPNESLVVGPDGGIANVIVFARKVSRVHDTMKGPAATAPVFDQKRCIFLSHVLVVRVGDVVQVKNSDPIGHNTNISPPGNPPSNLLIPENGASTYTFIKQLTQPVQVTCNIHPWMSAWLMARDDGYFAVTGPDGKFEIPNLPAGEPVEFQVWHEKAGRGLAAKPEWSGGRFTVTIPADAGLDLSEIRVPASALP